MLRPISVVSPGLKRIHLTPSPLRGTSNMGEGAGGEVKTLPAWAEISDLVSPQSFGRGRRWSEVKSKIRMYPYEKITNIIEIWYRR